MQTCQLCQPPSLRSCLGHAGVNLACQPFANQQLLRRDTRASCPLLFFPLSAYVLRRELNRSQIPGCPLCDSGRYDTCPMSHQYYSVYCISLEALLELYMYPNILGKVLPNQLYSSVSTYGTINSFLLLTVLTLSLQQLGNIITYLTNYVSFCSYLCNY